MAFAHEPGGVSPPGAWSPGCLHDKAPWLRNKFHLLGKSGLIEQRLRHTNAAGIPDLHDARFGRHVTTV